MASAKKKVLAGFLVGLVLGSAVGAMGAFMYFTRTAEEMAEVTKPVGEVELPIAEIRAQLLTGSFREKQTARRQIGKLPEDQRLKVLQALATDEDTKARLIAATELGKLGTIPARTLLQEMAQNDPDEMVKTVAIEQLTAAPVVPPTVETPTETPAVVPDAPKDGAPPEPGKGPEPDPAKKPASEGGEKGPEPDPAKGPEPAPAEGAK